MRRLWITGAGGVVGTKLVEQAVASGAYDHICALTHGLPAQASTDQVTWMHLAIEDEAALTDLAAHAPPQVIINPAAMTNVDRCESQHDEASRANAAGPRMLARVARAHGAHLFHVSTDYVFPGDAAHPGPYREDAVPRPINYYGQSKLDGEVAVRAEMADDAPYAIVRTALVYGLIPGGRMNFVTWLVRELQAGRRVRIVRDQFNTPTLADDLAALLLWQAAHGTTGIYHGAGPDLIGRHDWALRISAHFKLDSNLIDWVSTAELGQPAPRPLRSGLQCARWEADQLLGAPVPRPIEAGLATIAWDA